MKWRTALLVSFFIAFLGIFVFASNASASEIKVQYVGSNNQTSSAPAGITTEVYDDYYYYYNYSSDNPALFTGTTDDVLHVVNAYNIPSGSTVTYGTCTYPNAGGDCTVSSYSANNLYCGEYYGMYCYTYDSSITPTASQNIKVSFRVTNERGDVRVVHVGENGSTATAPAGIQAQLNGNTQTANPVTYAAQAAGSYTFYVADVQYYSKSIGTCTYATGGSECTVSSYPITPTCSGGWCSTTINVNDLTTTKVQVRYIDVRGDVIVVRVGTDNTSATAPLDTRVRINDSYNISYYGTTSNPSRFNNEANPSIYVTDPRPFGQRYYNITYGTCTFLRTAPIQDCEVTNYTPASLGDNGGPYAGAVASTTYNTVTKIVFKFDSTVTNGDIHVFRIGPDGSSGTVPAGTRVRLNDSYNISYYGNAANPTSYLDLITGTSSIYVTGFSEYIETVGYCMYPRGGTECNVTSFSLATGGDNAGQFAGLATPVAGGYVTKVVFRYDNASTNGDVRVLRVGSDGTANTAPLNTRVRINDSYDIIQYGSPLNPHEFNALNNGTSTFFVNIPNNFTVTVGTCNFLRTATSQDCTVSVFNPTTTGNNAGAYAQQAVNVQGGVVTKVVFRYDNASTNGDVRVLRVGSDGTANTAPLNTRVRINDSYDIIQYGSPLNPHEFNALNNGTSTFFVNIPNNFTVTVGTCNFLRTATSQDCTVSVFNPTTTGNNAGAYAQQAVNVQGGVVTKVVFRYSTGARGDYKIYRVGGNDLTSSAPVNNRMRINDSYDISYYGTKMNPYESANEVPGNYSAYIQDTGFTETVGICTYARGASECTPSSYVSPSLSGDNAGAYRGHTFTVSANTVTKVVFKYNGSTGNNIDTTTGDVRLQTVGGDNSTDSGPIATYNIASHGTYYGNPTYAEALTPGTKTVSVEDIGIYTETYGTCTYARGASECTVSSYNQTPTCSGGNCSANITVTGGQVTKISFRYTVGSVGDARVRRVGQDDTAYTSPTGANSWVDSNGQSSSNPVDYPNLSIGNHVAYSNVLPAYSQVAGICTYPRGGVECRLNPATDFTIIPVCTNNVCAVQFAVTDNTVTRIVFKYNPNSTNGDVVIRRVGTDDTAFTAPPSTQAKLDNSGTDGNNPSSFTTVFTGPHVVYATDAALYSEKAGVCTYPRGGAQCVVTNFNQTPVCDGSFCSLQISVTANVVTRVVFKYTSVTNYGDQTNNGDIRIRRVGFDDTSVTLPDGNGGNTGVGGPNQQNGATTFDYTNLYIGPHTVYANDVTNYTETAGSCVYTRGQTECRVTNFNLTPTCANGQCFLTVSTLPGQVTRVVFKYVVGPDQVQNGTGNVQVKRTFIDETESATGGYTYGSGGYSFKVIGNNDATPSGFGAVSFNNVGFVATSSPFGNNGGCNAALQSPQPAWWPEYTDILVEKRNITLPSGMNNLRLYFTHDNDVKDVYFNGVRVGGNYSSGCANIDSSYVEIPLNLVQLTGNIVSFRVNDYGGQTFFDSRLTPNDTSSGAVTTYGNTDNQSAQPQNPALYNNLRSGPHIAYATDLSLYSEVAGICTYPVGGTECVVTNFNLTPFCDGSWCRVSYDIANNTVTRVVFKYVDNNSGDITVSRLGTAGTTAGAPANTYTELSAGGQTADNPRTYTSVALGSRLVQVTDVVDMVEVGGTCTYTRGQASDCTITSYNQILSCDGSRCNFPVNVEGGKVTKVGIKYESNIATVKAWAVTCQAETDLPDWVMKGNASKPATVTEAAIMSFIASSNGRCALAADWGFQWGPEYADVPPTYYGSLPAYSATYGTWNEFNTLSTVSGPSIAIIPVGSSTSILWFKENLKDNHLPFTAQPFTSQGGIPISAEFVCHNDRLNYDNMEWIKNLTPNSTYHCVGFNVGGGAGSGNVRIQRVDQTNSPMVTQTTVQVNSLSTSISQPADYVGLSAGSHTVKTSDLAGMTEKVAMCSYPIGSAECQIVDADYDYTDPCEAGVSCAGPVVPVCNGTWCSIGATVAPGTVTKVSFKYIGQNATSTVLVRRVGANGTTTTAPSGTQAKIGAGGTASSSNPARYAGINGSFDAYVTDVANYQESFGTCTYTAPATNCTVSSYTTISAGNCTGGFCRATANAVEGSSVIVQFKYTAEEAVTRTCSIVSSPSVVQTNRLTTWSIATTPADNYRYSVTGSDLLSCASDASPSSACSSVSWVYTTPGQKTITAKVFSPTNPLVQYTTCTANINTIRPSIIEI